MHKTGANGPGAERNVDVRAVPVDTRLYQPTLINGRALQPDDGRALLLSDKLASEMRIHVGDQVIVEIAGAKKSPWTVVGLTFDVIGNTAYVYHDTLTQAMNQVGRADVAEIKTKAGSLESQQAIEKDLRELFETRD